MTHYDVEDSNITREREYCWHPSEEVWRKLAQRVNAQNTNETYCSCKKATGKNGQNVIEYIAG